jgi:hypothetical protein
MTFLTSRSADVGYRVFQSGPESTDRGTSCRKPRRTLSAYTAVVVAKLREFAPYAALELVMPGGSLMALGLWLYRRQRIMGSDRCCKISTYTGRYPALMATGMTSVKRNVVFPSRRGA